MSFLIELAYYAGRVAYRKAVGGYVMDDDGSGSYYRAVADGDTRADGHAAANPAALSNVYRLAVLPLVTFIGIKRMPGCEYVDARGYQCVSAYKYTAAVKNRAAEVYENAFFGVNQAAVVAVERRFEIYVRSTVGKQFVQYVAHAFLVVFGYVQTAKQFLHFVAVCVHFGRVGIVWQPCLHFVQLLPESGVLFQFFLACHCQWFKRFTNLHKNRQIGYLCDRFGFYNMFLQSITIDTDKAINVNDSIKAVTETLVEQIMSDPNGFMKELLSKGLEFGLKLVAAIAIYLVGAWLIRRVKKLLVRRFEHRNTEGTLASFVTSLVTITLTVLLVTITIGALGINTTSLAALLAAGGMAIGMALSGSVSNFAGGLMLLIFKPFKAGDYIKTQGFEGIVTELSIFHTKLRTYDNRVIVVPNGALSNGNIENIFHYPVRRIGIVATVEYGTDADKCADLLLSLMKSDKRVLTAGHQGAKDPSVRITALNDSNVEFTAWIWTKTGDYWDVMYDMNRLVYTELPKNGIQFAYPHMDIDLNEKKN